MKALSDIKFAHIAPMSRMEIAHAHSGVNLVLAQEVKQWSKYRDFYANSNLYTIIDNGAFELGKSIDPYELLDLARVVQADCIVLPDDPLSPVETKRLAELYNDKFKSEGFDTMFVPQAWIGGIERYLDTWRWAVDQNFDLIGCSILGAVRAVSLVDSPKQERVGARYRILCELNNMIEPEKLTKRIHMLGMLDTVREIDLCKPFKHLIKSWDSSVASWYGLHGIDISQTYTKFESPVKFNFNGFTSLDCTEKNLKFINHLVTRA